MTTANKVRTITVSVEPTEDETWEQVLARIVQRARPQWEDIRADMEQNPEWEVVDTRPELDQHMLWLYQHICPQDGGEPWGWSRIAEAAGVSRYTVGNAVRALAQELAIEMPTLRAGRRHRP